MRSDDPSGCGFERRKQCCDAMPLVTRGQSCGCAGTARHIGRQHRLAPRPAEGRSSAQTLAGAAYPAASESACRSSSYRSAACRAAACLAALVGIAMPPKADNTWLHPNFPGDQPGAAPGRRQQDYPRPLQITLQMPSESDNTPQAACDLSSKGGLPLSSGITPTLILPSFKASQLWLRIRNNAKLAWAISSPLSERICRADLLA